MAATISVKGKKVYFDEKRWAWILTDEDWNESNPTEYIIEEDSSLQWDGVKCQRCGRERLKTGEDPCLGHLPGVKFACCGHGTQTGYITFENGVTIRGWFHVDPPDMFGRDNLTAKPAGTAPGTRKIIQRPPPVDERIYGQISKEQIERLKRGGSTMSYGDGLFHGFLLGLLFVLILLCFTHP